MEAPTPLLLLFLLSNTTFFTKSGGEDGRTMLNLAKSFNPCRQIDLPPPISANHVAYTVVFVFQKYIMGS
ncbi:unnamed protein product [Arabidopsis thaliana]|uniref:(thale cress) hypothetical protein n=1 Tax=Arabidopsis thaliana TaxID=3702 RepID=A0A7G2E3I1_ARATH|nr:unnamed protein product [Arabidopsis thaliana]